MVSRVLGRGDMVAYEPTVYPGATDRSAFARSGRHPDSRTNTDVFVGCRSERINPVNEQTATNVRKGISASTPAATNLVNAPYRGMVSAGSYRASRIVAAEASTVVENTQHDLNIEPNMTR
jgi:UDP-N-acetyl-D-galactosamine dehydrogenase